MPSTYLLASTSGIFSAKLSQPKFKLNHYPWLGFLDAFWGAC